MEAVSRRRRRGTPLPLSPLVEESRSRGSVPNHLLESKIYAKLKSNSLIQAEPSEIHFSGFELGREYKKTLKLINVSSEVMNIHIVPTQTRHFHTTYTKKFRLIPGLCYTLEVAFCPDEWRYFYDCVRVHCQGEENLLVPVHAYPVLDDLNIPTRIDLPAVPLGHSLHHLIPLHCSCPVAFQFRAFVLQPHPAFSVQPMEGEIPAGGEAGVTVTFHPVRYETSQATVQLVVSQFSSRPFLCTVTGSCSPSQDRKWCPADPGRPPPTSPARPIKIRRRSTREAEQSKSAVEPERLVDVKKILMRDSSQPTVSSSGVEPSTRQLKEALFTKSVQRDVKDEQENRLRWQVRVGAEPMTERTRRQILDQRETGLPCSTVRSGGFGLEEDIAAGRPRLSSTPVVREAGQAPEGRPSFQFYTAPRWAQRRRALRLFQQAARKILIRCRGDRILESLKNPKNLQDETTAEVEISPRRIFPSTFPVFSTEDHPTAGVESAPLPVDPVQVTVTTSVPFFKLQVPQHYKLMNYQPVSTWEAFTSYIPASLARTLRPVEPQDHQVTRSAIAPPPDPASLEDKPLPLLSFSAPASLLGPAPSNPLRIFNPAPGLRAFKPPPRYLESELESHLCPLDRFSVPLSKACGMKRLTPANQKTIPEQQMTPEVTTWRGFNSAPRFSRQDSTRGSQWTRPSVHYSPDLLPLAVPPHLATLPDDLPLPTDTCSSDVQLSPAMIAAQFPSPVAIGNHTARSQETQGSKFNQRGRRAMARLRRLEAPPPSPTSPPEETNAAQT